MPLVIGLGGDDSWKDPLNLYGGEAPEAPKPIQQPSAPPQRSMFSDADRNDLVNTIIAEAAGEGDQGMAAVASVIRNRSVERGLSPGDVVRQRRQFSGYEAPGPDAVKAQRDPAMRSRAEAALDGVFDGSIKDTTGGADHYHADSIMPDWAGTMPQTAKIGRHVFYKAGKGGVPEVAFAPETQSSSVQDPFQAILNPAKQAPKPEGDDGDSTFLLTKLQADKPKSYIENMKPELRTGLTAMFNEAPDFVKNGLDILSGARSPERQAQIIAENAGKYGLDREAWLSDVDRLGPVRAGQKWRAQFRDSGMSKSIGAPGGSRHQHGDAADLGWNGGTLKSAPKEVVDWVHQNAGNYGLAFPLSNENWHIETAGARGGHADDAGDDLRPFHAGEQRPNADGSYSTEISTTWQMPDGKWVNVPSLWMGKDGPQQFKADDEEGILGAMQKYEAKHGATFARFDSEQDAVAAAEKRSAAGGAGAGPVTAGAIVIDENYKPANGLGFMTGDNPLAAIAGQERQRAEAERTQVADQFEQNRNRALTEQHNTAVGDRQQKLEADAPGRYVEIDESELPDWQQKWEADNRSGGLGGDTKRILESGTIGIGQSLSSLADTLFRKLPGGEAFLKASDDIDKWAMGKTLDQRMTESQTRANSSVSERQGEADAKNWWDEEKHTFGPAWRDPRSYLRTVGESAPSTVVTMLPGGIMARGAYLRAIGAGLGERAAAATAARTATLAGAITEGTMGGADSARNVRQKIEAIPRDQLAQSDAVKAMVQGGMSQDEAIKALTEDAASQAFLTAGVATGMFGGMGDRALAKIIGEGVSGGIARRIATGAAKGFVGEGLLEEAPQGAAQQVAENAAVRRADPNQSLTEGVGEAVASGVAAGGAMGAGLGGVGGAARPAASPEIHEAAPVEAAPAPAAAEAAPQPRGPLGRAVQHAEQQIQRRNDEAAAAAPPAPVVEAPPPTAAPAAPTDGRPHQGATVRVDADGIEPFMARVDGYEGDEAVVIDSGSGEVYQVPLANITQIAKSPEELNREQPIEKGVVPIDDAIPEFSSDPALEPQAPMAGETKSEPPSPKQDTQQATERLTGKPQPGQRVIVDDKDGGRFTAKVDSYEEGDTEAVVTNDDGEVLQVPIKSLYVDKLTPKQIEAQDLKRDPPIKRERADAGPNSRRVFDKTMVMPDDDHAALYDLAKDRFIAKKTGGAAHTDLERVGADEVQRLADRFKVSKVALTSMADDYRYRVDRAAKEARSELPQKMPPVNDTRLRQWQRDRAKEEAAAAPAAEQDAAEAPNFSDWWDLTLDDLGRKKVLEQAGVKRSERAKWGGFTPAVRKKLEAFHQPKASPADVSPIPTGFTTAKGSTYVVHEDGTTSRNKAARNDPGHEGDSGQKERSAKTVYVDTNAGALSAAGLQGLGSKGARVAIKDGKATLVTWNEKQGGWGASEGSRDIPLHDQPAKGRYPLELWKKADDVPGYEAYAKMHAGNEITDVSSVSADMQAAADADVSADAEQTAYHGTGNGSFDSFSTKNIGSGEGENAFGWGMYFAGSENVADTYRKSQQPTAGGSVKKVSIPANERLLSFDEPLSAQPQDVQRKLATVAVDSGLQGVDASTATGADFYEALSAKLGSDKAASEALLAGGIPGHSYRDAFSREGKANTRNFVIYGDDQVKVLDADHPNSTQRAEDDTGFEDWLAKNETDAAAHQAATSPENDRPEPSQAQKEAGNYKLGHVKLGGLDISVENPAGSEREGVDPNGKPWSVEMKSHYGYIKGTVGKDKDHVDVFVKPGTEAMTDGDLVFVVDQKKGNGHFDEHKAMLGFSSEREARAAYLENYSEGWNGLRSITATTLGEFKDWLKSGKTDQPYAARNLREDRFPEIASLKPISFGPGGRVNPKAIEPGAALYREMSTNGLEGILLHDDIADVANFFVANRPELALGQGLNRGVHVAFRPDSLSGREHQKPGLATTRGKEFTVDMVAPRSVAVITLPAREVKKLRARVRQILSTEFTRRDVEGGLVTFTRDGLDQSAYDEALGFAEDRSPDPIIAGSANDMRDVEAPEGKPSAKWAKESVVAAGQESGHEYLAAIDDDGTLVSYGTAGKSNFTGLNDKLLAALANPTRAIDIHHNHPQSGPLSAADIGMLAMPGLRSVAAYGHDGTESTAQLTPEAKVQYPGTGRVEAIGELTGMLRKVQQALKPVLDRAVRRGEITPDEAAAAWSALPGLAARDAGIINLKSSVDFNPASVPGLEAELAKAVSQLKEDFANGRDKVRAARVRGSADALGRSADVAELAESGQRMAGKLGEGGLSEGSSRNDQGEEWHDVERQLGKTEATPSKIVGAVSDALSGKFVDVQPHLLATVPLNYFPELAGGRIPAIDDYLLVKRKMDAYRGVKHDEAVKVIDQWRKLISKGFVGTDKSRAAQLADLMHAATLAGVDPSVTTDEEKAKDGWQALRKQFLALPPKGQELFQTVRDAYRKQADETDQLLLDNVRKAQEIALQQAEQRYRAKLDEIADKKMSPPDRRKAEEDAASTYKAESTKGRWAANARMTRLRQQFESNRVPAPYFPLGRFGRYFTVAKDIDGKVLHFGKHETKADMDNALKALTRELPNATLGSGVMEEGGEARKAMDPRVLAEIETMLANSGVGDDIRDALYQRYLETMPDLSMRKRFIHRKGTPGYNRDAFRVFASTMFHGSHQMARLKYGLELQENVNLAVEQAQDQADNTRDMTLVNELQKRDKWVRSPTGAAFTNWLTSVAYVWYMGLSPAAALVNASQTVMLGVPLLGAKFGVGKSSKALLTASKDFAVGKGDVRRSGLSKDERAAMNAFYDSGLIDRTQSHDLAAVGETGTKYNPIRAKAMNIVSWGFHNVEVMNREITALAAYRLARDAGQGHLEAINTAHERTYAIHFDMSNSSRPRVMQSDFAKTALMFRSYQINMLYRLFRDAHQSLKGETPAVRREARMQLAGATGMMTLLAGATGTVGYGLLMTAASLMAGIFGDDDDPMEIEDQFKAGVINTLGPELGGILLNGLPGHYLGIDLTSRIGMPDLWFRSPNQDLQGREEWQYWVLNSLGASVSLGGDMFEGFRVATDEKSVARGLETMAPKAVRDLMKTWRYAWEGVKSRNGDEVLPKDEVGVADVVKQALGFTPAKIRETYDRNSALRNAERKITDDRRRVMNAFAKAVEDKDPDARREALEEIKRFNAVPAHRPVPITSDGLKASLKARARNRNKKVDGVLIQNEKLGNSLRKELPPSVYR